MKQKASYDGENIPLDAKVRRLRLGANRAIRRIQQQCVPPVRAQCYAEIFISPSLRQNLILSVRNKEKIKKKEKRLTEIALSARRASTRHTRSEAALFRVIAIASVTGLFDHNPCLAEGGQVENG